MAFVRTTKRANPFVQLDKEFIGNGTLSLKATGLLTYFLSKPDGWVIRLSDVQNRFSDGETSIRSGLNELMRQGYVYRERERSEDGTFGDYIYHIYERPEFNPKRENHVQEPKRGFPELDKPELDDPELDNHAYSNNDFSNNDSINKEDEEDMLLSDLMDFYLKNISQAGREAINDKLKQWLQAIPYPVIKAVLENCALYGAKSWAYVEKALKDAKGIQTVEELNQKHEQYKSKQANPRNKRTAIRKEVVPDYIAEESKTSEFSEEELEKKKRLLLIQQKYKDTAAAE